MLLVNANPKMLREALCIAQTRIGNSDLDVARQGRDIAILQLVINACDVARPLGQDGKHGALHTDNCGCEL